MKQPQTDAERWLAQAENDLAAAELLARGGFAAQACFACQQAAEKALKAVHYRRGARFVHGHSLVELLGGLAGEPGAPESLRRAAQVLDQHYLPTRYPNGLPGGTPFEVFAREDADEALGLARGFIDHARAVIRARA